MTELFFKLMFLTLISAVYELYIVQGGPIKCKHSLAVDLKIFSNNNDEF